MNPFEMVVAIVLLGVAASVITTFIKAREEKSKTSEGSQREVDELRDQIVTLEDRIRVLERIVTDTSGKEDLKRQFRDLER